MVAQFLLLGAAIAAPWVADWRLAGRGVWHFFLGGLLLASGIALCGAGVLRLGANLTPMPRPKDDSQLTTTGVYGLVRHPIYGGLILLVLGYSLVLPTVAGFVLSVVTFVFFNQKASREEKWLRERYSEYLPYSMQTRKLIPWVF